MSPFLIKQPLRRVRGEVVLSGDKSIAHRLLIISSLAQGKTIIENLAFNDDNLSTIRALKSLGVRISKINKNKKFNSVIINGKGLNGLKRPCSPVYVGDSGTTMRLLSGLLAGQDFSVTLTAGPFLSKRPMLRVIKPLRLMGAAISAKRTPRLRSGQEAQSEKREEYPPLTIRGSNLKGITYKMPVASAQVKSAILLAGLYAKDKTTVIEKIPTRDHTERMLRLFKAGIKLKQNKIVIGKCQRLISPKRIYIPGDISSASFFMVLGLISPDSQITIKKVSLNPGRLGMLRVLKRMGANIKIQKSLPAGRQAKSKIQNWEPAGDLVVKSSALKGTIVTKKEIPSLIDELPVLMVAASLAKGRTVLRGVDELRVKETDRIKSMCSNLRKIGAKIQLKKSKDSEDIIIEGVKVLNGARVKSFGDHRTAMSMVVAGLAAKGITRIDDISCISKSFPDFIKIIKQIAY